MAGYGVAIKDMPKNVVKSRVSEAEIGGFKRPICRSGDISLEAPKMGL